MWNSLKLTAIVLAATATTALADHTNESGTRPRVSPRATRTAAHYGAYWDYGPSAVYGAHTAGLHDGYGTGYRSPRYNDFGVRGYGGATQGYLGYGTSNGYRSTRYAPGYGNSYGSNRGYSSGCSMSRTTPYGYSGR